MRRRVHSAFNIFALFSLQEVRIGTLDTLNTSTSGEFDVTPWIVVIHHSFRTENVYMFKQVSDYFFKEKKKSDVDLECSI